MSSGHKVLGKTCWLSLLVCSLTFHQILNLGYLSTDAGWAVQGVCDLKLTYLAAYKKLISRFVGWILVKIKSQARPPTIYWTAICHSHCASTGWIDPLGNGRWKEVRSADRVPCQRHLLQSRRGCFPGPRRPNCLVRCGSCPASAPRLIIHIILTSGTEPGTRSRTSRWLFWVICMQITPAVSRSSLAQTSRFTFTRRCDRRISCMSEYTADKLFQELKNAYYSIATKTDAGKINSVDYRYPADADESSSCIQIRLSAS